AHPRWRGDGKELFYLDLHGKKLLAVAVKGAAHTFEAEVPVALFDVNVGRYIPGLLAGMYHYDVTADGQHFLVNTLVEEAPSVADYRRAQLDRRAEAVRQRAAHILALGTWCPDSRGRSSTYGAQKNVSTCLFLYQQSDGAVSGGCLCAPLLRCPLPACL